jgi:hypothetical protein
MTYLTNETVSSAQYGPVTPSDSVNFTGPCRAIFVGVQGDLSVVRPDGVTVVLAGVLGLLPIVALRVNATATTAESIVALF